jgi:hypothetical protein
MEDKIVAGEVGPCTLVDIRLQIFVGLAVSFLLIKDHDLIGEDLRRVYTEILANAANDIVLRMDPICPLGSRM